MCIIMVKSVQILGTSSPRQGNFVWVGPPYGICFMSFFWHFEMAPRFLENLWTSDDSIFLCLFIFYSIGTFLMVLLHFMLHAFETV
jgi:hypothetical protein